MQRALESLRLLDHVPVCVQEVRNVVRSCVVTGLARTSQDTTTSHSTGGHTSAAKALSGGFETKTLAAYPEEVSIATFLKKHDLHGYEGSNVLVPTSQRVLLSFHKSSALSYIILSSTSCAMLLKITRCMRTRIVSKAAIGSRSDVT
jgi:hypothetical protein